jgi:hypothetical protein
MDDAMFELLKRIDEGFELGSNNKWVSDGIFGWHLVNGPAITVSGDNGFDLRMAVMKEVEAEKARRKDAEGPVCAAAEVVDLDLMEALKASLAMEAKKR